jgi:hypothetical protein
MIAVVVGVGIVLQVRLLGRLSGDAGPVVVGALVSAAGVVSALVALTVARDWTAPVAPSGSRRALPRVRSAWRWSRGSGSQRPGSARPWRWRGRSPASYLPRRRALAPAARACGRRRSVAALLGGSGVCSSTAPGRRMRSTSS